MDFRHLRYFIAVAEEENIGRAAARLHISQPPLTRQIHQLETQLGVQLFNRTPKGMELTTAGEMFLQEARNIRALVDQAVERTQRAGMGKLGRLDIGIFGSGILDKIPRLLERFRDLNPDVRLVLHNMEKHEQVEALRQRRINMGFSRLLSPLPDIAYETVACESLMIALNERHPLAAQSVVSFKSLANFPLILFPTGSRPSFIDKVIGLCHQVGFEPQIAQEVGDAVTAVALVARGLGASLVSESTEVLKLPGLTYRPLSGLPENAWADLGCIYRPDDESPALGILLEIIREFRDGAAEHLDEGM